MYQGIITPMITIFTEDRQIDWDANRSHIEHLITAGVNGILFLGSIGEFFTLTEPEKREFTEFAVKTVNRRVPVFIGTGGTVVEDAAELTKFAGEAGADGAVIISPYYFALDAESIYNYYAYIAETAPNTSILLYNFPDRTQASLEPELVARLAKRYSNIIGIKDTVDNLSHTRRLILSAREELGDFCVFSGFDEYMVPNLLSGGNGAIGGLSNVVPELFAALYRAYQQNDLQTISRLQQKMNALMAIYSVSTPFVPALKYAASLCGSGFSSSCRRPIGELTSDQKQQIKAILASVQDS